MGTLRSLFFVFGGWSRSFFYYVYNFRGVRLGGGLETEESDKRGEGVDEMF